MTDLEKFRDHARIMAQGGHTDECIQAVAEAKRRWSYLHLFRNWPEHWGSRPSEPPMPCAGDYLSTSDRSLFAALAAEIDAYLTHDDDPLWDDA